MAKTPHIRTAVAPTAVARIRDIVDIKVFYKPMETPSWSTAGYYALREKLRAPLVQNILAVWLDNLDQMMIDPSVHRILHMYQSMGDHGNDHAHLCPNHNGVHNITSENTVVFNHPRNFPADKGANNFCRKPVVVLGANPSPISCSNAPTIQSISTPSSSRASQIEGHVAVG